MMSLEGETLLRKLFGEELDSVFEQVRWGAGGGGGHAQRQNESHGSNSRSGSRTDSVLPAPPLGSHSAADFRLTDLPQELLHKVFEHLLSLGGQATQPPLLHRRCSSSLRPARSSSLPANSEALPAPPELLRHTTTSLEVVPGLKDLARASCANKLLNCAFRDMLTCRADLALQVESNIRAVMEKQRLVRRLTLTHHGAYMRREVACEVGGGGAVIMMLMLSCAAWPGLCGKMGSSLNFVVFTLTHVCMHTAILAGAYRAAASIGIRRALVVGLLVIAVYYVVIVGLVQMACGITHVPPHLDLEPYGRSFACHGSACSGSTTSAIPASFRTAGALADEVLYEGSGSLSDADAGALGTVASAASNISTPPYYPLAVIVWPLFGTSWRWRAIHVLSNSFAWCYGVWEFSASYGYIKQRNGLH